MSVIPMLKGRPVLVMRRGLYPNRNDIVDVQMSWPGHIVRTEAMHQPYRFVVTVSRK